MADAVGADTTSFSTCGSSLSVKAAMTSVAGPGEELLISRNAHEPVIAGVAAVCHEFGVPLVVDEAWAPTCPSTPTCPRGAWTPAPTWSSPACTRMGSAIEQSSVFHLVGREVVRPQGAFDLDPLALTVDVRALGTSGYQAGDWLRAACQVDVGPADACRTGVRLTHVEMENAVTPREAFSGPVEQVPVQEAVGRVLAELVIPDAADPTLQTLRVVGG